MMRAWAVWILGFLMLTGAGPACAQQAVFPAEITGDQVEFDLKERKVTAIGNVSITKGDMTLTCDRAEFYRDTEIARAYGRVAFRRGSYLVEGDALVINFQEMSGDFENPRLTAVPFYGAGDAVKKVGEKHFQIRGGYLSTCDFDEPQSRVSAQIIDVYPGDKAVARNVVFRVGKVPVFFWPRYTEDLKDRRPMVRFTPGYSSDWGGFLLSRWRFDRNENFKTFLNVDYRERKDVAWGIDNEYNAKALGKGAVRTYYMNERSITSKRIWDSRPSPTVERERYKAEWRHRVDVDETMTVVSQYYKLSDADLLKDYFEDEYRRDQTPPSYVVASRRLPYGTLTARADYRVNRFTSTVDRLPEIGYSLPASRMFGTGFYFKNTTTLSSLVKKDAAPADYVKTDRVHIDNEVSYPAKVSFVEIRPFVGIRQTYYNRTRDAEMRDAVRGIFRTGVDMSTKFFRVYDVSTDAFNLDINDLRHVVTPSIAYEYQHSPGISKDRLVQYDSIDAFVREHKAVLALENKLQTKRKGESVDVVRTIVSTDFAFQEDENLPSSFNNVNFKLELQPYRWVGFYFDTRYNPQTKRLETANADLYVNGVKDRWYLRVGDRYHHESDHQFEAEAGWKVNPKWTARVYQRFDFDSGRSLERSLALRRDLHSWNMDVVFKGEKGSGTELLLVFSLKGFDEVKLRSASSFGGGSERPGAQ